MNYTNNAYEIPWTEYTASEVWTLNLLYYVTPPLSLMGSVVIVYVVKHGRLVANHRFKPSFVRLLTGFSMVDIVHSIGYLALGPWAVPEGTPWVHEARGNLHTCNAKGFFLHMMQGLWIYSAGLAVYHALKVRFECKDACTTKYVEPAIHVFAWMTPVCTGIILIPLGLINPVASIPGYCWISELPTGCDVNDQVECVRGEGWFWAAVALSGALSGACLVAIAISVVLIYWRVRTTEARIAQFGRIHGSSAASMELTRKTGRRAMWYIGAFFLCNLPTYLNWAGPPSETAENPNAARYYFIVNSVNFVLFPLQGFLHACIFLHDHRFVFQEDGPLYGVSSIFAWRSSGDSLSTPVSSRARSFHRSSIQEASTADNAAEAAEAAPSEIQLGCSEEAPP